MWKCKNCGLLNSNEVFICPECNVDKDALLDTKVDESKVLEDVPEVVEPVVEPIVEEEKEEEEKALEKERPNFCTRCGNKLALDAKFCNACGLEVGAKFDNVVSNNSNPDTNRVQALVGMILGIVSIVTLYMYGIGAIIGIPALVLSINGLKSTSRHKMALAGVICSSISIGIVSTIIIVIILISYLA